MKALGTVLLLILLIAAIYYLAVFGPTVAALGG